MFESGPSKYCPHCDTPVPLRAAVCDNCGYRFDGAGSPSGGAAPQGSGYGALYDSRRHASGGWPQSQPDHLEPPAPASWPQSQPRYAPQGWPGYDGPPAPVEVPRSAGGVGKLVMWVLVVVLVVGGGAAAWLLYLSPSHSNSPLFDAHGVPANVPLPNNLTFDLHTGFSRTNPSTQLTASLDEWGWKVADSDPLTIAQFYREQLPGKGWTNIRLDTAKDGHQTVIACQPTQVLGIDIRSDSVQLSDNQGNPGPRVIAPPSGSALGIALVTTNSPELQKQVCLPDG